MGFLMGDTTIQGGDSYGVKSNFIVNGGFDVIKDIELMNKENKVLGDYRQSNDALRVSFDDGTTEYLYLY